ncbi:hypothetical protein D3C78_1680070 [compost metagenome]
MRVSGPNRLRRQVLSNLLDGNQVTTEDDRVHVVVYNLSTNIIAHSLSEQNVDRLRDSRLDSFPKQARQEGGLSLEVHVLQYILVTQ